MSFLANSILQSAAARFQNGDAPGSAFCIWAARYFGGGSVQSQYEAAFRSQAFDRIEDAQRRGDIDLALQLDALSTIFEPDLRLRVDQQVAASRAVARCLDAMRALGWEELEQAAGFSLSALALEPENPMAPPQLREAARRFYDRRRSFADGPPTLEGTLFLAFAVALGLDEQRQGLAELLYGLEDFASVALLCRRIEEDRRLDFAERRQAVRLRLQAEHRALGVDQQTAEAQAEADFRDWLVALGPSSQLEQAALRERVVHCFGYGGYRRLLADLRELRRRDPDDVWVAENLCMILYNALHPDVAGVVDLIVEKAENDVERLERAYATMSMIGAMPQALTLAERLAAHQPDYAVIGALHQMATDRDARPARVFGQARCGRKLLYANLVCWGAAYIDLMEQAAIASLLAPGNMPALAKTVDVVVEIFTMPGDLPQLLESAALRRLGEHCEIRLHAFPETVAAMSDGKGYVIYGYALHATALRAERDGADLTFLLPDIIYADGGYGLIAQQVTSAPRAIFADGLNALASPLFERAASFRHDGVLAIPPQQLMEAAIRFPSKRTLHSLYGSGDHRTCVEPTRVIFPLATSLRTHGFMMLPIYVSHAALAPLRGINFRTPDGLFLEHVLNNVDDDQLKVMSGSEFCFAEIREDDGFVMPLAEEGLASRIRKYFMDFGHGHNRLRLFVRPVAFPMSLPPDIPIVSEEEADARVREVQEMFATDPSMIDLAEEQQRVRETAYRR